MLLLLLLEKYLGEKRLRSRRLLQPVPRGRVLRLRLRLRLAALWREAALAIVEQVLKEQLLKVMLAVVRLLLTMTAGPRRRSAIE